MSKLLIADENFPFPSVEKLRELGHDVTTLRDYDLEGVGLADDKVLELATNNQRAILTFN